MWVQKKNKKLMLNLKFLLMQPSALDLGRNCDENSPRRFLVLHQPLVIVLHSANLDNTTLCLNSGQRSCPRISVVQSCMSWNQKKRLTCCYAVIKKKCIFLTLSRQLHYLKVCWWYGLHTMLLDDLWNFDI